MTFASDGNGDLSLYDGFTPCLGDSFILIDNEGSQAISGTFTDGAGHALGDGAVVRIGQSYFALNYEGGDGNDLVLTDRAAPTVAITSLGVVTTRASQTISGTIDVRGSGLSVSLYDGATLLDTGCHAGQDQGQC